MNGRRAIGGLCMLCALLVSAIAAQGASAAGTTAHTCAKTVPPSLGVFTEDHCRTQVQPAQNLWAHVSIPNNTTTTLRGSAAGQTKLKATIGGIATELVANTLSGTGSMENKEAGGEMFASGTGTITYTEVAVASPAGKGCKVSTDNGGVAGEEGLVHTNTLKATTQGQGEFLKFEPNEGEVFATFIISGCTGSAALEALNKTYTVTGSVKGVPTGATTKFTHAETTTQGNLKLNGSIKAGIEGDLELEGEDPSLGSDAFTPLSATTT